MRTFGWATSNGRSGRRSGCKIRLRQLTTGGGEGRRVDRWPTRPLGRGSGRMSARVACSPPAGATRQSPPVAFGERRPTASARALVSCDSDVEFRRYHKHAARVWRVATTGGGAAKHPEGYERPGYGCADPSTDGQPRIPRTLFATPSRRAFSSAPFTGELTTGLDI